MICATGYIHFPINAVVLLPWRYRSYLRSILFVDYWLLCCMICCRQWFRLPLWSPRGVRGSELWPIAHNEEGRIYVISIRSSGVYDCCV